MNRIDLRVEGVFNRKSIPAVMILAGTLGASAVALGAWAAHGLEASHGRRVVDLVETAVRYQLIHALAAVVAIGLSWQRKARWPVIAAWLFVMGAVLFCGALHLLAFGGPRWLGAVAPFGGVTLIAGWLALAVGGWRAARSAD